MAEQTTKRFQVRADKRVNASADLPESIYFILRRPQYRDAWVDARQLCNDGVGYDDDSTIEYVSDDGKDTYEGRLKPGQYTVKQVLTLDKAQGAASKAKEPTAVELMERAQANNIGFNKKLQHLVDVMREEKGLNTGNPEAKAEAEENIRLAKEQEDSQPDETDEASADEQRAEEDAAADEAEAQAS